MLEGARSAPRTWQLDTRESSLQNRRETCFCLIRPQITSASRAAVECCWHLSVDLRRDNVKSQALIYQDVPSVFALPRSSVASHQRHFDFPTIRLAFGTSNYIRHHEYVNTHLEQSSPARTKSGSMSRFGNSCEECGDESPCLLVRMSKVWGIPEPVLTIDQI